MSYVDKKEARKKQCPYLTEAYMEFHNRSATWSYSDGYTEIFCKADDCMMWEQYNKTTGRCKRVSR